MEEEGVCCELVLFVVIVFVFMLLVLAVFVDRGGTKSDIDSG